jgi:hypothetical protein
MELVCEGAPDPGWSDGPLDARKARLSDVHRVDIVGVQDGQRARWTGRG